MCDNLLGYIAENRVNDRRYCRVVRRALQHDAFHVLQHEWRVYVLATNVNELLAKHREASAHDARGRLQPNITVHIQVSILRVNA